MTRPNDPADGHVVVVGGGLSGIATALGAALHGRSVTVFEAAGLLGGAAAYSGGQVWVGASHVAAREGIEDDLDRAERYVRDIARRHPELLDDQAMRRWLATAPEAIRYWEQAGAVSWTVIRGLADYHAEADGALASGRYLTSRPFQGSALGPWRARLRVSPYFRTGTTYEDMFARGRRGTTTAGPPGGDVLTLGAGLVAQFLARALREEGVEIQLQARVTELLRDSAGQVVGARAETAAGPVERFGPVVLATSSFDWNPALVHDLLGLSPEDFGSLAPDSVRGDGIMLARAGGGAVARIPATCVPMVPGWRLPDGTVANGPEYAMPHAMIVDGSGRRFCNDSYWVDLVPRALDPADRHLPFFLVVDEQHHRKYGLGSVPPGAEYPAGLMTTAPTLRELGRALGVDGQQLEATAARFSEHAERGEDPDFGRGSIGFVNQFSGDPAHRPNPVLGPVSEPPFHGLRLLLVGTGIGCSGVHADADGHVLDESGAVIPRLYAVGSCAATTTFGSGYNSGMALSRGLTLAYLVAAELGGYLPESHGSAGDPRLVQMADGQEGGHHLGRLFHGQLVRRHDEVIQAGVARIGAVQPVGVCDPRTISPVHQAHRRGLVEPAVLLHPAVPGGPRCHHPHMNRARMPGQDDRADPPQDDPAGGSGELPERGLRRQPELVLVVEIDTRHLQAEQRLGLGRADQQPERERLSELVAGLRRGDGHRQLFGHRGRDGPVHEGHVQLTG